MRALADISSIPASTPSRSCERPALSRASFSRLASVAIDRPDTCQGEMVFTLFHCDTKEYLAPPAARAISHVRRERSDRGRTPSGRLRWSWSRRGAPLHRPASGPYQSPSRCTHVRIGLVARAPAKGERSRRWPLPQPRFPSEPDMLSRPVAFALCVLLALLALPLALQALVPDPAAAL